jgi:hypothetical protein
VALNHLTTNYYFIHVKKISNMEHNLTKMVNNRSWNNFLQQDLTNKKENTDLIVILILRISITTTT